MPHNSTIQLRIGECIDCLTNGDATPKDLIAKRCQYHYRIHKAKEASKKQRLNQDVRKLALTEQNKQNIEGNQLEKWFRTTRTKMTGVCIICGGGTCKDDDKRYKRSIAHLLPKRKSMYPSIATNPANWIELCFWNPSCHTNFDNGIITFELIKEQYPKAWNIITEKFKILYTSIYLFEKRNLPDILLQTL